MIIRDITIRDVYEKALRALERGEINLGQFDELVDVGAVPIKWIDDWLDKKRNQMREIERRKPDIILARRYIELHDSRSAVLDMLDDWRKENETE